MDRERASMACLRIPTRLGIGCFHTWKLEHLRTATVWELLAEPTEHAARVGKVTTLVREVCDLGIGRTCLCLLMAYLLIWRSGLVLLEYVLTVLGSSTRWTSQN